MNPLVLGSNPSRPTNPTRDFFNVVGTLLNFWDGMFRWLFCIENINDRICLSFAMNHMVYFVKQRVPKIVDSI